MGTGIMFSISQHASLFYTEASSTFSISSRSPVAPSTYNYKESDVACLLDNAVGWYQRNAASRSFAAP